MIHPFPLRIISIIGFLTALSLCIIPHAALSIEVNGACREVHGSDTVLLLDLTCPSDEDCWPDPDDVTLADGVTKESTGWAISDMIWLSMNGKQVIEQPDRYPARAVWDISAGEILPETVMLIYDSEPLTDVITPDASCAKVIPQIARDELEKNQKNRE